MKKVLYAFRAPSGQYWDGEAPFAPRDSWLPKFKKEPVGVGREITMKRKLARYRAMQSRVEGLPDLVPIRLEVRTTIHEMPTPDLRAVEDALYLQIMFRLKDMFEHENSEEVAADYERLFNRMNGHCYIAEIMPRREVWQKHDPEALWGKKCIFLKEDAAVLFHIAYPKAELVDLRPLLGK